MPRRRNDLAAFSPKQLELLTWWTGWSPHRGKDAVICHGAVRSGKTFCMGLSFITWAMEGWDGQSFAICGKSRGGAERNLVDPLLPVLQRLLPAPFLSPGAPAVRRSCPPLHPFLIPGKYFWQTDKNCHGSAGKRLFQGGLSNMAK